MKRTLIPALLSTMAITLTGCPICSFPIGPSPLQERGLQSGRWMFELEPGHMTHGCPDMGPGEAVEIIAFLENRSGGDLTIDLDGIRLKGQQQGRDVFALGTLEYDIAVDAETEEVEHEDHDDSEDDSEGGESPPPPCEVEDEDEDEDEDDRPTHPDDGAAGDDVRLPRAGVVVELSAIAEDARWMYGDLLVDYIEDGRVRCSYTTSFGAWHQGNGPVQEPERPVQDEPRPGRDEDGEDTLITD